MSDRPAPLLAHLGELKRRLILSVFALIFTTALAFAFHRRILQFLLAPASSHGLNPYTGGLPVFTDLTELWGAIIKLAVLTGLALASPFFIFQVVRFVGPALRTSEKAYLYTLLPASLLAFAGGVAFGYYVLIPPAVRFLVTFGSDIATPLIRIGSYVNLITMLLFWMGVSFELPIVIFFLTRIGVVTPKFLARNRRWAIILAFVAGAAITPTFDPVNQSLVAGPIIVLYEIGYVLSLLGQRRRKRAAQSASAAEPGR
ncbi:MAG: twin-arginine translocase subunit TatC [Chloroflexi bacterium]|nr:twin-arginine translocase subunit TatC [Chloroflexota bacterium]